MRVTPAGGDRPAVIDGEVVAGEPAGHGGLHRLGLITARCPALPIASRSSPVP